MFAIEMADVPFGDQLAWRDFLFRHSQEHAMFANAIYQKYGRKIDAQVFPDEGSMESWLQENNYAHSQEMQAIGIEGINLVDVDLRSEQAYNEWMAEHAMLHQMTKKTLGL